MLADKVAAIRRMLEGIRSLPLDDLAAFTADPRMVAAGDSYLRRALEALLDLGRHVLAKGFGRAPAEYAEVARQLGEVGVVDSSRAARLTLMARHRNRMVHFYDEITDDELTVPHPDPRTWRHRGSRGRGDRMARRESGPGEPKE